MSNASDPSGNGHAPVVTGNVVIGAGTPALHGACVHVRLEDVSYADRASELVGEAIIPDIHHAPSSMDAARNEPPDTILPFTVHPATTIDPRGDYAVRVWVDADGDGRTGPGDLYSDQSYRVLTHGFHNVLTIRLGTRRER